MPQEPFRTQNRSSLQAVCEINGARGVFEFRFDNGGLGYATVQAVWALYRVKYRYPQWIEQHYQ
jgi:hypothetical protein